MDKKRKEPLCSPVNKLDKKERELIARFKENDANAFDCLFEEYKDMILRVAHSLVGEREMAKDISQEVFIRIHRHLGKFAGRSTLRTWIYRITVNTAKRHVRKRSFLPFFDAILKRPDHRPDPLEIAQQKEEASLLSKAISRLPFNQKQAFILKNREGLRYSDIAEILDTKIGTVKTWVNRATNNLRKILYEEENDVL